MTSLDKVYDAFLAKIMDDAWDPNIWSEDDLKQDWRLLMDNALARFKFPRVSLEIDEESEAFKGDLSIMEIQILSTYMKCEWLNREIDTWERIKPLYEERDFSEANMLDKLYDALTYERKEALKLEAIYYRSISYEPWDYTKLAGG